MHRTAVSLTALLIMLQTIPANAADAPIRIPRGTSAHLVASPSTALEHRVADRLTQYLELVLGKPVVRVTKLSKVPGDEPAIVLVNGDVKAPWPLDVPDADAESFVLKSGLVGERPVIAAAGHTDRGLKRAVQQIVMRSRQEADALVIPPLALAESPWIPAREWTACPWSPFLIRGVFHNPNADLRLDIFRYNDARLAEYVEMFDWFGYSGCQLMETCYTYAAFGGTEDAQAWQKRVARFLRDNGQQVSLWAWAAQFNGFGWIDPSVTYTPAPGNSAFDDPAVRATFEKYYDHYAELAPYIDRFFGHFYDPGELKDRADVFKYMRLLEEKLRARNPSIQMGLDGWAADQNYTIELAKNGFEDYTLLEIVFPELYPGDARIKLHEQAKAQGLRLGMWGWYVTEYETDQLASMYVNARLIHGEYQGIKQGADAVYPLEYWSEMEAHHLNNIYSMYAAGQLLWNPDRDPDELLAEISDAIWGPKNAPAVTEALRLIQDMRTGETWKTYWWTKKTHRVGSDDAAADLKRATDIIAALDAMQPDAQYVPKLPLPYPPATFIELMRPHLLQIQAFAQFRVSVDELKTAAQTGEATPALQQRLDDLWQPVPEYNTWVGVFDNKERREQKKIVREVAAKYGLKVNDPASLVEREAGRVLMQLQTWQKTSAQPYLFDSKTPLREFFWPEDNGRDRFNLLIERGLVVPVGDKYRLADWEAWRLRE